MAPPSQLAARIGFMHEASGMLAHVAPSVSSYIGSERESIYLQTDQDLEEHPAARQARRRHTCGRCGQFLVPGSTCRVRLTKTRSSEKTVRRVVYDCSRCSASTALDLPTISTPKARVSKKVPGNIKEEVLQQPGQPAADIPPTTANASSKKRAKARKQGGLAAMLSKSKASTESSSGFGLDLMDLMKGV